MATFLVSSVKSLFISLAYHPDIPHIFHRISAVLKEMKLRGLFMAMTMVKVRGQQLSVSIAGMPSVLMDGMVTRHELSPSSTPGQSTLTITGEDLSILMDIVEMPFMRYPATA